SVSVFVFLRLPPPPSSTLFPYTTLFRSRPIRGERGHVVCVDRGDLIAARDRQRLALGPRGVLHDVHAHDAVVAHRVVHLAGHGRSEEHTSELQSRRDLVCRLLLEKKKNT